MTAATMTRFDLRAAVLAAAAVEGGVTVAEIAEKVFASMTADEINDVVRQAISETAADILRHERRASMTTPSFGRSPKQDAIRTQWQRMLVQRLHIGDGVWKVIGDCTAADLDYAASARYKLATEVTKNANQLQEMAASLRAAGVTTVKELPVGSVDLSGVK